MAKESFVFYRSFYEAIKKLKKSDQLTVYSHLCRYALGEEVEEIDGVPAAIFELIKPQIDANLRRYENGMKGAEYGKLGGRPKTPKEPLENPKQTPNVNVNDNVNENVNVNGNGNAAENPTAAPDTPRIPSLDEVKLFAQIRESVVDPEAFYEYYQARDWKTTKGNPVDWRLKFMRWEREDKMDGKKKQRNRHGYDERTYDYDQIERELFAKQMSEVI